MHGACQTIAERPWNFWALIRNVGIGTNRIYRVLTRTVLFIALAAAIPCYAAAGFRVRPLGVKTGKPTAGFEELEAVAAGIAYTNVLTTAAVLANNNYMNGSGVAAGDFDGDGWCDLYFCAIAGTNALYRNLGGWKFEEVTPSAGVGLGLPGLHSTGAMFSDVDGDRDLDLLVALLGGGVRLLMNEGGRFQDKTVEAGLVSRRGSMSLAMADVDGDGDLDLYVTNYGDIPIMRSGGRAEVRQVNGRWVVTGQFAQRLRIVDGRLEELGEPDALYLNDGSGRFRPVPWDSEYFVDEDGKPSPELCDFGLAVQMRDLNDDGAPDIYVCNDFQTPDRVWLNDGAGRFRALPRLAMRKQSYSSMGVDFADLDHDSFLDFFVVEMLSREHALRMRQMVSMTVSVPVPGQIEQRPQVTRNTLFRNRGDGTYSEMANFSGVAATDWAWQPVFMDVDLDAYEDLLVVNGMLFDILDRDVLQRIQSLGQQTPEQSRTNLLLFPKLHTRNAAWRNKRDLTFEEMNWNFRSSRISQGIALADLDRDGDLDVTVNCLNDAPLLYRNESAQPRLTVRLRGQGPNSAGIGARIRVHGGAVPLQTQEMIRGGRYLSCDDTVKVFAAGNVTNVTNGMTLEVLWRSGRTSVVQRVAANCEYELEEPSISGIAAASLRAREGVGSAERGPLLFRDVSGLLDHRHHEEFFSDYARQPLLMKQFSQLGPGVGWLDLDGDGHDELILGSGKVGSVDVFRRTAAGKFERMEMNNRSILPDDTTGIAAWSSTGGRREVLIGLANYESVSSNRHSMMRLAVETNSMAHLSAFPNIENGPASTGPVAVADLDGDGDLDLFVGGRIRAGAYPEPIPSRIFRQDAGHLILDDENSRLLDNAGMVSGAVWSDLNADGFPELVLACEWGPIRIFLNDRGRLKAWNVLDQFTGWWSGVTTGDFDEDGRLDIVAGNWGLNDASQATPDRPLRLYFGIVAPGDLIESYYAPELNAEVPRRTLTVLGQAFPMLAQHYPSHLAFSTATIGDLLGKLPRPAPDLARQVAATTLASTLFLNRGSNFLAVPLPAEAQLAPVFAVNVADFDGDGHEDLFLSQNFFAVRPEWPRLDSGRGLVLRGDGKGGFSPLPGQVSGVLIYGEQRAAAVGDFNEDARVDLVVSQNGAATCLFENTGGRPGLRVRLRGGPQNPDGIGAVLRLEFGDRGDRLGPAREVHAGSGYWSQDSVVQILAAPPEAKAIQVQWPGGRTSKEILVPGNREVTVRISP